MNDQNISVNDSAANTASSGLVPVYERGDKLSLQSQITQTIGTQDMVSIRVAKKEDALRDALAARTRVQKEAKAADDEARVALSNYIANYASEDNIPSDITNTDALHDYFKHFKGNVSISSDISDASINTVKRTITFTYKVTFRQTLGYSSASIPLVYEVTEPWSSELVSLYEANEAADKTLREATQAVAAVRSALANIESMEREARAKLSSEAIRRTEGGEQLLEQLTTDEEEISTDDLIDRLASY